MRGKIQEDMEREPCVCVSEITGETYQVEAVGLVHVDCDLASGDLDPEHKGEVFDHVL